MKKISVIGIGKLGLCFALVLERAGYNVIGCDIKEDYVKSINDKTFKTVELKVEKYLKESKNFEATTNLEKIVDFSDIIFITVRTTSLSDGSYDCSQVDNVINDIIKLGISKNIKQLIISCNVNPGYSNEVQEKLKKYNYIVNYNPEWIAQGSIIHDQEYPDLVVIGENDERSGDIIKKIYNNVCLNKPIFHRMDRLSAEITKISLNCSLVSRISTANMIGEMAIKSGVDPNKILNAIGSDSRIGNKYFKYGFGYGGPCFPRDVRAFIKYASIIGVSSLMVSSAEETNKRHLEFQVNNFIKNNSKEELVVFDSITYKPGVTIIEESQQLLYAVEIAKNGYKVLIKEHIDVIKQVQKMYGDLFLYKKRL